MKAIQIPNGNLVTLSAYAKAWAKVKNLPPQTLVPGWDHFPTPASTILAEMREALDERINRHLPPTPARAEREFWELRRLNLSDRVRVYEAQVPKRYHSRLAHRIVKISD